jgi:polysaccharide biosynthesis transport protein
MHVIADEGGHHVSDRDPRSPAGATPHRRSRRASSGGAPARRHAARPSSGRARSTSSGGQSVVTIGQFFATLRRQFVLVLVCLVLGVGLSAALLIKTPKTYQSTAVVDITPTLPTSSGSGSNNGVNTITEAKIATSSSVALGAAKKLGFNGTPSELAQHVTVTSPLSSQVLNITFASASAQGAADGANAFAQSYLDYRTTTAQADLQLRIARINDQISQLQQKKTPGGSGQIQQLLNQLNTYRTMVVTPGQVAGTAAVPPRPSAPKPYLYLAGGLLLGLLLGAVLAMLRDRRDDRVRGKADLEPSLGAPVIAEATSAEVTGRTWPRSLVALTEPRGAEADAYRTVTTTVTSDSGESQIVMLCSTGREGRSLAPMNLAATYALQGVRTVLAGPHAALAPAMELLGITELPAAEPGALPEKPVPSGVVPDLSVLDLGDEVSLGATLRNNGALLEDVLAEADLVVLDGVNIELPSTSLRLGQLADEVVVLVYPNRTTHQGLEALAQHLAQVRADISGAILLSRQPWHRRTGGSSTGSTKRVSQPAPLPGSRAAGRAESRTADRQLSPARIHSSQPGRRHEMGRAADSAEARAAGAEQRRSVSGAAKGN